MGLLGKSELEPQRVFDNVQYTRLKEEQLQPEVHRRGMPGFEGYLSFNCKHCGHLQILQGTELDMILGKSLKMAFRPRKAQSTSLDQSSSDDSPNKNNIPMTSYSKPFQESLDGSSIGIPVLPGQHSASAPSRAALSSDESNSPTQLNQFKRLVEKPSLMKRIGKGFGANVSDEEYPLVSDGSSSIPGSQSNISLTNPDNTEMTTLRIRDRPQSLLKAGTSKDSCDFLGKNEANLKMAPWYQEGIPREIALEILGQEPIGSFMVRKSTTKAGCFALSVRVPRSFQPRGIAHYLIMRTGKGYRIKGFTKDFPTMASLIAHHSVMPELLPCPLSLSRYHPVCVISDCRRDFADIQPKHAEG
ncbi:EGFR adapter protein-like isoform X1 [Euwallacea fornicatus]|uniref:EGFR adapter protein-like isoform X1 n=2 Tax=Euwallacea fornicatus TaxID=995702 RepID=UPI00338E4F07